MSSGNHTEDGRHPVGLIIEELDGVGHVQRAAVEPVWLEMELNNTSNINQLEELEEPRTDHHKDPVGRDQLEGEHNNHRHQKVHQCQLHRLRLVHQHSSHTTL